MVYTEQEFQIIQIKYLAKLVNYEVDSVEFTKIMNKLKRLAKKVI